jgi:hypothetical protein
MEQSTAQANALKTLDARRAAAAAPPPLPPLNDPVLRPQQPGAPPPQYQQPGYQQRPYQQPGQPIIVQQPNNGLMHGVIGFMLGQSLGSGHRDVVYQSNGNNGNGNNGNGSSGSNGSNGGPPWSPMCCGCLPGWCCWAVLHGCCISWPSGCAAPGRLAVLEIIHSKGIEMGWSNAYQYLRAGAARRGVIEEERADGGLPLGARIGSLVSMQQTPLIRAAGDGSLIALPDDGPNRIVAVSQIKLKQAGGLYRLYLATGDLDARERFLQVYQNPQGQVTEIMYCTQLARVIPETAEDQDAYMGSSGSGLGDRSYTLWRSQLGDVGLDEAGLDLVFGNADSVDYWRDAGDPQAEFVAPFSGTETRLDDAGGQHGLRQEMVFMPYVRQLRGGGKEYLLITTEIVSSVNGDASKRGIHVDFVIGIPVEQERIVMQ